MREILKYIKLYTGCNDHALKRIEAMLEPRLKPIIIEKIVEVEKVVTRKINTRTSIAKWSQSYFIENGITYNEINQRSRTKEVLNIRNSFVKKAYLDGFTCTSIAKYLNRDHSTILHSIRK
jgi:chromosomal replication initiation ATPase DnaA